jgi:hypothetical protein
MDLMARFTKVELAYRERVERWTVRIPKRGQTVLSIRVELRANGLSAKQG